MGVHIPFRAGRLPTLHQPPTTTHLVHQTLGRSSKVAHGACTWFMSQVSLRPARQLASYLKQCVLHALQGDRSHAQLLLQGAALAVHEELKVLYRGLMPGEGSSKE